MAAIVVNCSLILLHSERLNCIQFLAFLSAIGLMQHFGFMEKKFIQMMSCKIGTPKVITIIILKIEQGQVVQSKQRR